MNPEKNTNYQMKVFNHRWMKEICLSSSTSMLETEIIFSQNNIRKKEFQGSINVENVSSGQTSVS